MFDVRFLGVRRNLADIKFLFNLLNNFIDSLSLRYHINFNVLGLSTGNLTLSLRDNQHAFEMFANLPNRIW